MDDGQNREKCNNHCEWMNVFMLIMKSKGRGGVSLNNSGHQSLELGKKTQTVIMLRKFETEHTMHYESYKIKQFGDKVWLEYLIAKGYNLHRDV